MVKLVDVGSGKSRETGEDQAVLAARLERLVVMNACLMEARAWCDALYIMGDSEGKTAINPLSIGLIAVEQMHTLDDIFTELKALVAEAKGEPPEE